MGKKQAFNSGAKMGIRLSEHIVKRDADAIEYLNSLVKQLPKKYSEIQDVVSSLIDKVEKSEIEKLYGIVRTKGVEDLEYEEQIILLKTLQQLATYLEPNINQRNFMRRLSGLMGININDVIFNSYDDEGLLDSIDSRSTHRLLYQITKEYLFLGNNSHNYQTDYDFILDQFSRDVNNNETESLIDMKVALFGTEILFEQYGDVSFELSESEEQSNKTKTIIDEQIKSTLLLEWLNEFSEFISTNEARVEKANEKYNQLEKCRFLLSKANDEKTRNELKEIISTLEKEKPVRINSDVPIISDLNIEIESGTILNPYIKKYITDYSNSESLYKEVLFGFRDCNDILSLIVSMEAMFIIIENRTYYVLFQDLTSLKELSNGLRIKFSNCLECDGNNLKQSDIHEAFFRWDKSNHEVLRIIRHYLEMEWRIYHYPMKIDKPSMVRELIKREIQATANDKNAYIIFVDDTSASDKQEKSISNALNGFAAKIRRDSAVALIDNTIMGNGKDGVMFGIDGICFKCLFEKIFIRYEEIREITLDHEKQELHFSGDFKDVSKSVESPYISGSYYHFDNLQNLINGILCII